MRRYRVMGMKQRFVRLRALIQEALRQLLSRKPDSLPGKPAPAFRLYTVRGKLVNPNLDLDRTSGVVAQEDEAAFDRHPAD